MSITTRFNHELSDVALAYGNAMIDGLRENLIKLDKNATGDLLKSLSVSIFQEGSQSVIRLSAKEYLRAVDKGTPAGQNVNLKSLSRWLVARKISRRALFPIANKIKRDGIKPTNVVETTLKQVENSFAPELEAELKRIVGVVLVNDVFGQTNTRGKIIPANLRV